MDEKPDQIIGHIEAQRDELGRNLSELENRVRRSTDWHTYYDRNPMLVLGAALGGGLLLGATIGGRGGRGGRRSSSRSFYTSSSGKSTAKSRYPGSAAYTGSSSHIGGTYAQTPSSMSSGSGAGSSAGESTPSYYASSESQPAEKTSASWTQSAHMKQIADTLEVVKGALISFGVAKAKEFLAQAVPGLDQHLGLDTRSQQFGGSYGSGRSGQSTGSGYGSEYGRQTQSSEQTSRRDQSSGTGTGANDYRSGSAGYGSPTSSPSTGTGTTSGGRQDEYAGTGSGRTPNVTP